MLDLLLFLVKLPFILIGAVVSLLSGIASLVLGLVSGLWTLFVSTLVVLLVLWLVVALLRRRRAKLI